MKTELKAKFLQHLVTKKKDQGFTLIELLVVIIIIGILSAIALPSFLNQANKAKQSEAKQYVGTLNRSQQAYFLENSQFATSIIALAKPVKEGTNNYIYGDDLNGKFTRQNAGGTNESVVIYGTARKAALRAYAGLVGLGSADAATSEATTLAILCESDKPLGIDTKAPAPQLEPLKCGAGSTSLEK